MLHQHRSSSYRNPQKSKGTSHQCPASLVESIESAEKFDFRRSITSEILKIDEQHPTESKVKAEKISSYGTVAGTRAPFKKSIINPEKSLYSKPNVVSRLKGKYSPTYRATPPHHLLFRTHPIYPSILLNWNGMQHSKWRHNCGTIVVKRYARNSNETKIHLFVYVVQFTVCFVVVVVDFVFRPFVWCSVTWANQISQTRIQPKGATESEWKTRIHLHNHFTKLAKQSLDERVYSTPIDLHCKRMPFRLLINWCLLIAHWYKPMTI